MRDFKNACLWSSPPELITDLSRAAERFLGRRVRAALWVAGAADFVHDPRAALHEDLWADARAIGDGVGRAARMGGKEPARHLQDADHRRHRIPWPRSISSSSGADGGEDPQHRNHAIATLASYSRRIGTCERVRIVCEGVFDA
jgi:hypothetical protein